MKRSVALRVSRVSLTYTTKGDLLALRNVTLTVRDGEFVALLGPSGCGKSSLLHVLAGFIAPSDGACYCFEEPVTKPGSDRGLLFQQHTLFPWKTAIQNVLYPLVCKGVRRADAERRAQDWIAEVGLDGFEHHYVWELSGGMQQRVSLARLFAASHRVLLMDEPFGGLDAHTKLEMQEALLAIWEQHRGTVLFVTHDIEEALLLADRVLIMSARPGSVIEEFSVPLRRPRAVEALYSPELVALRKHVLDIMRQQHRKRVLLDRTERPVHGQEEIRLGCVPDVTTLHVLAAAHGALAEDAEKLEVFVECSGDAVIEGVETGVYETGMVALVAAIAAAHRGRRFRILTGWSKRLDDSSVLAGLALPTVQRAELGSRLGGLTIGVNGIDTLLAFLVRRFFDEAGEAPTFLPLHHGTLVYALREGLIQGAAAVEPWLAGIRNVTEQGIFVTLDRYLPPGPTFVLIANENSLRSKETVIRRFTEACSVLGTCPEVATDARSALCRKMALEPEDFGMSVSLEGYEHITNEDMMTVSKLMKAAGMLAGDATPDWGEYVCGDQ